MLPIPPVVVPPGYGRARHSRPDASAIRREPDHRHNDFFVLGTVGQDGWIYLFDAASVLPDDGFRTLRPLDVPATRPGRWRRVMVDLRDIPTDLTDIILQKSYFSSLALDASTSSLVFVDLLTLSFTSLVENDLVIWASCSFGSASNNTRGIFRVTVDGTPLAGAAAEIASPNDVLSVSIIGRKELVAAGAHVVKLQWRVNANTARCRPISQPDQEHASLLCQEYQG